MEGRYLRSDRCRSWRLVLFSAGRDNYLRGRRFFRRDDGRSAPVQGRWGRKSGARGPSEGCRVFLGCSPRVSDTDGGHAMFYVNLRGTFVSRGRIA